MEDLLILWNETKEMLNNTLPSSSKVFLSNLDIKDIDDKTVTIKADSEFVVTIMKDHKALIENYLSEKTGHDLKVSFIVEKNNKNVSRDNNQIESKKNSQS